MTSFVPVSVRLVERPVLRRDVRGIGDDGVVLPFRQDPLQKRKILGGVGVGALGDVVHLEQGGDGRVSPVPQRGVQQRVAADEVQTERRGVGQPGDA